MVVGIRALIVLLVLLPAPLTRAGEIEGQRFAERLEVGGVPLALHGLGLLRYKILFKAYVAGLYFGESGRAAAPLADAPRRLEIHYFYAIRGGDFARAADQILRTNLGRDALEALRPRLERLNALYRDVEPGDRYALTYLPGVGTELSFNGAPLGTIPGSDFAAAYFGIWLGPNPIDTSLRDQLLRSR